MSSAGLIGVRNACEPLGTSYRWLGRRWTLCVVSSRAAAEGTYQSGLGSAILGGSCLVRCSLQAVVGSFRTWMHMALFPTPPAPATQICKTVSNAVPSSAKAPPCTLTSPQDIGTLGQTQLSLLLSNSVRCGDRVLGELNRARLMLSVRSLS
jgi:hypothetical protein